MATLSVALTPTQDAKYDCNPDGAFLGGLVVEGATASPETPSEGFTLAMRLVYTGGTQTAVVKLEVSPGTFIQDDVVMSPAAAANLRGAASAIDKL